MDALQLKLRSGAGPFRSFGNIAVEPRAYQLVPLLMAMKQPTVRLLIADDVGIGKTIEGALIAREMLDRGEIHRMAVLCPPHLCEQWQRELEDRFHIQAVVVRSSSATRLERDLPPGTSVFDAHPFTVVSLDYIKSERRREAFQRFCPEFVIVDEAHTCTQGGQGRQQRFQLLKGLAENPQRHMVLLTATPTAVTKTPSSTCWACCAKTSPSSKTCPSAPVPTCVRTSRATSSSAAAPTLPSGKTPACSPTARRRKSPTS